jgi:predicted nuclease of predicted toxin-antitoxin system
MGTLASELRPFAEEFSEAPRVYADANLPAGVVAFMRQDLKWDVLFVVEHDDLRRAPDAEHYRRALDLGRTLITLDRDFCDDLRFPLEISPGVVVLSAPDEPGLVRELRHLDRTVLRIVPTPLPLRGRKLQLTPDQVVANSRESRG